MIVWLHQCEYGKLLTGHNADEMAPQNNPVRFQQTAGGYNFNRPLRKYRRGRLLLDPSQRRRPSAL